MPITSHIIEDIENLVVEGEIERAFDHLEAALGGTAFSASQNDYSSLRHTYIALKAKWREHARDKISGTSTDSYSATERQQIIRSVLLLAQKIARTLSGPGLDLAISGPPNASPELFEQEAVINPYSPMLSIAWMHAALRASTAVCRIVCGHRVGTGFLVNNEYVVTCNHVMPTPEDASSAQVQFLFDDATKHAPENVIHTTLTSEGFATNAVLDVSVAPTAIRLPDHIERLPLSSRPAPAKAQPVTIIQHPLGGPKKISASDNAITAVKGHILYYSTTTENGTSGAPVFDDSFNVIAVHTGTNSRFQLLGGRRYWANSGTAVSAIIQNKLLPNLSLI